jgi:hypothetical protein
LTFKWGNTKCRFPIEKEVSAAAAAEVSFMGLEDEEIETWICLRYLTEILKVVFVSSRGIKSCKILPGASKDGHDLDKEDDMVFFVLVAWCKSRATVLAFLCDVSWCIMV